MKLRCRCVWEGVHCPNLATQEDGLCDWCTRAGERTEEQLRANPNALITPDGEYLGQGGAGEVHDVPLVETEDHRIPEGKTAACWYPDSRRTLAAYELLQEPTDAA